MEPHTPTVSKPDALTAPAPTIADIVGVDREDEARALLEQVLAIYEESDPDIALIVRRRVLDLQSWDVIAAEVEMPASLAHAQFMQWAEEIRFYLTAQTERQTV